MARAHAIMSTSPLSHMLQTSNLPGRFSPCRALGQWSPCWVGGTRWRNTLWEEVPMGRCGWQQTP